MKDYKVGLILGIIGITAAVLLVNKPKEESIHNDTEKNIVINSVDREKYGILVHKYQDNAYGLYYYLVKSKDHYYYYESKNNLYKLFFDDFREYNYIPFKMDRVIENPSVYISMKNTGYITDNELTINFELIERAPVDARAKADSVNKKVINE